MSVHDAKSASSDKESSRHSEVAAPPVDDALFTKNSSGRSGAFYLPAGYNLKARPLLVAFHGSDGSGEDMVTLFRTLAAARSFIIVAPDSRLQDGHYNWVVGTSTGEVTEDYTHTLDCIEEVRTKPDVEFAPGAVLALGVSGGGSSAPYIATNESSFSAFAVLHGGVIQGGIGSRKIPGWFSTGQDDPARPPALVQASVDYMNGLGFADVTFEIYPGDHAVSSAEASDVVAWWLDR